MKINKITAIIDEMGLEEVEANLLRHGVNGYTLHPVRGRGRYFDSDLVWIHDKLSAIESDIHLHSLKGNNYE